ncbi:MAG: GNAT family N-acetyltransferase, partial [Clostridiaceae bacterium]|nr:GNAT family N-acetyltransferase [Clostridiaceae bacterium]
LLFVDHQYHRRGIATALVKKAVADCKELDDNLDHITVNSSPYAVPFYVALGFEQLSEVCEQNGIKFVPMKIKAQ